MARVTVPIGQSGGGSSSGSGLTPEQAALVASIPGIDSIVDAMQPVVADVPSHVRVGGRWWAPYYRNQVAGDTPVVLSSSQHLLAVGYVPECACKIPAFSAYVTAVGGSSVNVGAKIFRGNSSKPDPNYCRGKSSTNVAPVAMTGDSWNGYTAVLKDNTGADAFASGYDPFKAFDGNAATSVRSTVAPTDAAPLHFGLSVPTAVVVNGLGIRVVAGATSYTNAYFPYKFKVSYSSADVAPDWHNDAGWTTLTSENGALTTIDIGSTASGLLASATVSFGFINSIAAKHFRITMYNRTGTAAYVTFAGVELLEWNTSGVLAPGTTLVADLGTFASGTTPDAWVRHTFTSYQNTPGIRHWAVLQGEDGKTVSFSARRRNGTAKAEFPDRAMLLYSTDGGTTWTEVYQDFPRLALLNFVLDSDENHGASARYGAAVGGQVPIHNAGENKWEYLSIPDEGIRLSLAGLSDGDYRQIYLYNNGGSLASEVDTDVESYFDGLPVKTGDTSRLFTGVVGCFAGVGGAISTCDMKDARLLRNVFNTIMKDVGKDPDYAGSTSFNFPPHVWSRIGGSDYRCEVLCLDESMIWNIQVQMVTGNYHVIVGVQINDEVPAADDTNALSSADGTVANAPITILVDRQVWRGIQEFHPAFKQNGGTMSSWPLVSTESYFPASRGNHRMFAFGTSRGIPC